MPGADLEVTKSAFSRIVQEEGLAVFTVGVSNRGAAATAGVVLEDILPAGMNYHSHMTSHGTYNPLSGRWTVGQLNVGASASLELVATIETGTAHAALTNMARVVDAGMPDPDLSNNEARAAVAVSAMRLIKTADAPAYLDVGDIITYTIVASNAGSQIQTELSLTDALPAGLNLVPDSLVLSLVPESGGGHSILPGTGGTITQIEENGTNYFVHTFTSLGSSSFIPPPEIDSVEVLVVAGGGGGAGSTGNAGRGGGGGGGVVHTQAFAITGGTYTVVVGAGGAGGAAGGQSGFNGQSSQFGSLLALGGGGGGNIFLNGSAGGSGGGAGVNNSGHIGGAGLQPGSASGGYGQGGGGPGPYQVGAGAGGGGGAGALGGFGNSTNGGAGGAGREFLPFATVLGSPAGWVAGGGGGSAGANRGPAGTGGGGQGGTDALSPGSGAANSGGGGGGSQNSAGGNGGSGVVSVRYPAGLAATTTADFDSTGTFTVPAGVTSLVVEAWGGGGGPRNDGTTRRGGGGGGAYALSTIAVTPLATYDVVVGQGGAVVHAGTVGNPGGNSYFDDGTQVLAAGGSGGIDTGGAGGSGAVSIGAVRYSGGNGGARSSTISGGGGGGGGSAYANATGQNGAAGSGASGGAGGAGEGPGGNGGNYGQPGRAGNTPGGGGGGRGSDGGNGGAGASGLVRVTFANPAPIGTSGDFPEFAAGWQLVPGQRLEATFQVQVADLMGRGSITNLVSMVSAEHTEPLVAWVVNPTILIPPDVLSYAIIDPARITNQVSDRMLASGQVDVEFIVYHPAGLVLEGATFDLLAPNGDPACTGVSFAQIETIEYGGRSCQRITGQAPRIYPVALGTGRARISIRTANGVWLQSQTHAGPHPMEFTVLDNDVLEPQAMGVLTLNGLPAPSAAPDRHAIAWFNQPEFLLSFAAVADPEGGFGMPLQQREASGVGEYRITTEDVQWLTPAARALVGTACPVVAMQGALANRGFEYDLAGQGWSLDWLCSLQNRDSDPALVYEGARSLRQGGGGTAMQTLVFDNTAGVTPQVEFKGWVRGGPARVEIEAFEPHNRSSAVGSRIWTLDSTTNDWTAVVLPAQAIGNGSVGVLTVTLLGQGTETHWDALELNIDIQTNRATLRYQASANQQGQALTVFAVDDDGDRPADHLAGTGNSFFLPYDVTPPTPVLGLFATTDTVDDPTTQFDLLWNTAGVGPDDPAHLNHPTHQTHDRDILSPWQSYKFYYGIYDAGLVPENDPGYGYVQAYVYTNFVDNQAYREWPSVQAGSPCQDPTAPLNNYQVLTNVSQDSIRLYDLDYDRDYIVVVVGVDAAGNEGPASHLAWQTNNTIKFALIRGSLIDKNLAWAAFPEANLDNTNTQTAAALQWIASGPTNENGEYIAVTKEYDLIYWDAPRFQELPDSQWNLVSTVQTNWSVDDGGQMHPRGQIRFYRASYKDRWRHTNALGQTQRRIASEEVYSMHNVILSGGPNYVSFHGRPYTNTFAAVFGGTETFPGGFSALPDSGATLIEFYTPGTNALSYEQYFMSSQGRWFQVGGGDVTEDEQPPGFFNRGFSITLPDPLPEPYVNAMAADANLDEEKPAMVWSPIAQVPTNGFSSIIHTGQRSGRTVTHIYNLVALSLPVCVHPGEMGLLESGFFNGTRETSDQIYTLDTSTKTVRQGSTIYCDAAGVWRFVASDWLVPPGYFAPNDVIVLVSKNGGLGNTWTWEYHPAQFYTLPNRTMEP
jgi:uncharacterized repeat protein (TIGR01451 family)